MSKESVSENSTDESQELKGDQTKGLQSAAYSKQEIGGVGEGAPVTMAAPERREGDGQGGEGGWAPGEELEVKAEESQIHNFAQAGDVEGVRRCLMNGYNVDQVDEMGCTPVHLAGAMGHTNVVKLLVEEHGATVDARDRAYCTSLHAASEGGHGDMVALLLRLGAQIDARNGKHQTPLHYACGYGQAEAARQLAVHGASAGARDVQRNTPLHLACSGGGGDVVRLLINQGSDVDSMNSRGRRPLHLACRSGNIDVVVTLLEHGADPWARDAYSMQACDMIGAKRPVPHGVRQELFNLLERYQLGEYATARSDRRSSFPPEGVGPEAGGALGSGPGSGGGRGRRVTTQRELGAAVAERLEEMRALELSARFRATVQENEAMRRDLDSVKEEVRELKQKLSQHALLDPTASSTSLAAAIGMNVPTSAAAAAGTGAQVTPGIPDCTTNANLSSSTTVAPGRVTEGSIAEQLARGMYGTGGFAGLSLQPSSQQQEAFEQGQQGQQQRSQSIPGGLKAAHDVVMSAPTGVTSVEDEGAIRTARAVAGEEEETVTNVTGGGAGEGLRAGGARVGSVEAGWEWNEVRGKGPAPSHGGMEQRAGAGAGGGTLSTVPVPVDASTSGGGSSADHPVVGPAPVRMSQLLLKTKAQLENLLDSKPSRSPTT